MAQGVVPAMGLTEAAPAEHSDDEMEQWLEEANAL